jgi:periplasmic mercuric ion binding protein
MTKPNILTLSSALVFSFAAAWLPSALAKTNTVTLAVPGMSCPVCPITVRKALEKVPGVSRVKVTFETKEAVVVFDDAKTNIKILQDATYSAGYESTPKK